MIIQLLALLGLLSTNSPTMTELTVTVNSIEAAGKGTMVILLFDDADDFGADIDRAAQRLDVKDFSETATATFRDLAPGRYALFVFQDRNDNGKVDKNFIGIPKEPVTASNLTKVGRPSWKKASFDLAEGNQTINLKLLNQ